MGTVIFLENHFTNSFSTSIFHADICSDIASLTIYSGTCDTAQHTCSVFNGKRAMDVHVHTRQRCLWQKLVSCVQTDYPLSLTPGISPGTYVHLGCSMTVVEEQFCVARSV